MKAALLALAVALAACAPSTSQIGPYVKSVARNGAWLAVQRCMIVLEGNTLAEGECTVEQFPLGTIPQGAPVQMYPQAAPGAQAAPLPAPTPIPH
jgi:hypothetical protein